MGTQVSTDGLFIPSRAGEFLITKGPREIKLMGEGVEHSEHGAILVIGFAPGHGRAGIDAIRSYFTEEFLDRSAGHQLIVVDLSQVSSLDSSSLGPLVQRHRELNESGGRMVLCGLRHPSLREVFALTRFDRIFTITDTVDEALQELTTAKD